MRFPSALAILLMLTPVAAGMTGRTAPNDVLPLLERYRGGDFDGAIREAAAIEDLRPLRLQFIQSVPQWVAADPTLAESRRASSAAFLLELTSLRLESDWGRLNDLVEWTCVQMRTSGPPTPFELAWHHASVALASRARARLWLLGESPRLPHQPPPPERPNPKAEVVSPRHLVHALERYPDDAQLRLAQVVAWLWGRDHEPIRNTNAVSLRRSGRRPTQLEAVTALGPLLEDALVGADAELRLGLVYLSIRQHDDALARFAGAEARTQDVTTRYLAAFNAGRTLEQMNRADEAVQQYVRALEIIPAAESATIALASLHFVRDERERALGQLARVFAAATGSADPGRQMGYGSFVRWPQLKAALRAELPR